MNQQTEALKLALEALGLYARTLAPTETQKKGMDAITALDEALAQPQPQQEPVAWMTQARNFVHPMEFTEEEAKSYGWKAVYTTQPVHRKPLTERELMKCITQAKCFGTVTMTYESGPYEIDRPTLKAFQFARAIEAEHGIKGDA